MSRRTGARDAWLHSSSPTTPTREIFMLPSTNNPNSLATVHAFDQGQQSQEEQYFDASTLSAGNTWMLDSSSASSTSPDLDLAVFSNLGSPVQGGEYIQNGSSSSSLASLTVSTIPTDDLDEVFELPQEPQQSIVTSAIGLPVGDQTVPLLPTNAVLQSNQPGPGTANGTIICVTSSANDGATMDCIDATKLLVAELQVSSDRPCVTTANGVDAGVSTEGQSRPRDIDTVIYDNRRAIRDLDWILDCPCTRRQQVLLTVFLAAHQALLWYEAALQLNGRGKQAARTSAAGVLLGRGGERIVTSQVKIGNYCLDVDAQMAVHAHVVLSELTRHFQPLLSKMQQRRQIATATPNIAAAAAFTGSPLESWDVADCYLKALEDKLMIVAARGHALMTYA
ncbi:hypothetical protein M409DRAFT_49216 [Zasmidium cellare ATCC 36951]|uniref:Aflatoxin regulatory protein domain-containing protein n=1 Tax=Zasmidium cellare ATCC 36951 TaxID=1080233 RepID=A0A6A6CZK0_ZASCE|nr:uncharacterized protein M409DRAFT_49216 [Zasmidium cellare ATCC 36951]KAF2172667.1 hypothetical protein M409DRAFT_49216 [Zasmidium cellare ATCC 36951]